MRTHHRIRTSILLLGLLFCCILPGFTQPAQPEKPSQNTQNKARLVKGCVVDSSSQEPLIGVTIRLKEHKSTGTVTDDQGRYRLTLPDNRTYTLELSYLGYEKKEYNLPAGKSGTIDFQLKEKNYALQAVVVTGTRTPKLLKETPIVTRLISEEELKTLDAPNVQDVLQTELPGIEFSYSMNQQLSLNMSGFGGNSVLFLVDGERLAGETLDNVDYSRLNMDNVSRIEIVKGAASSLYGSNAVGGVVNLISRDNKEPWTCRLNARYGSHNDRRIGGSLGLNAGSFSNMLNVQYAACDPITLKNEGDYGTLYAYHTWDFKEKITYRYKDKATLTGKAGYFFRERESQALSTERYRDFSGGVKGDFHFHPAHHLELSYAFDQYDKSDYSLNEGTDIRDYSNVQNSLRALYNHNFQEKHTITIGGDFLYDYLMSYQFADEGSYRQQTADVFTQLDWNPSKRFNLIAALRFDSYSEAQVSHFSPKLGLMYKWDDFSLRASYADGFRAPTLKEMYMQFNMANLFMIYGNADLKAENSHNFSVSAEYTKNEYNFIVMGFHNRVSNRITTVWNKALNGMQYINMADLRISGVDANASARWRCGLSAHLSYLFTHEQIPLGQPEVSATRPHTATAKLCYGKRWENYGFTFTLTGRYLSAVTCDEYTSRTSFEETQEVTYPGYSIWKLSFNQSIRKGLNLTLSVDNLFNYVPDYYYNNSPATTGTTFYLSLAVDMEKFFRR